MVLNPKAAPPLSSFSARGSPGPIFQDNPRGIYHFLFVCRNTVMGIAGDVGGDTWSLTF